MADVTGLNGNHQMGRGTFNLIAGLSVLVIIYSVTSVSSLPNIRIQVNNENLQNPPYLLDAVKQAETAQQAAANSKAASEPEPLRQDVSAASSTANIESGAPTSIVDAKLFAPQTESDKASNPAADFVSDPKEMPPDEVVSLEAEPYSKSSQESAVDSGGPSSAEGHDSMQQGSNESRDEFKQVNGDRNFHLDVTSSHQKRPVSSALVDEEPSASSAAQQTTLAKSNVVSRPAQSPVSNVSPSVAGDDTAQAGKREMAQAPPDTLEPSQVMPGVTNASLVPATVRRHYGHQTRTRITLGGGYQRDQQPPLVNPSSSEHADDKPTKPATPLERPVVRRDEQAGSLRDNSRVIEVPERIVVPLSVFSKQQAINETSATSPAEQAPRRRDTRCPSNGVTSLEHPTACDRYFLCENGLISEQICPNGLMYGTREIVRDFCVHRWQAVCGDKTLPNPISSPGCRWQNGIFNVQGSPKCTPDFYECTDGLFEVKKCTISGQVYDDKTKSCRYAEQVGCTQEALADFQCPADDQANTYWPFPRYFLNERALVHCVSDKPQIIRCRDHERVDPEHLFCVPIDKNAPPVNEDGTPGQAAVEARRATTNPREKGKKAQKATR